jgi:glucan phosphorylase
LSENDISHEPIVNLKAIGRSGGSKWGAWRNETKRKKQNKKIILLIFIRKFAGYKRIYMLTMISPQNLKYGF